MYLKSLTLKGFKSFAEPASIRLEPGVTVVVGPNGSGKSNVVDAVAWVLGAQAPSAVRSARMDDVIFAGTAHKPALGRAEVSLTIDNSDGTLPVALSEVRITRTLFRDGESSYALNGTPCRLLDISELLSDTGVGRQQHVIVSQSQIDAVLNARSEDRRAVVEEAAGVLKYRKRRERAERRLLATDGDLTRISDLLREVRRRLHPLHKQAEAARRHAGLLSELEALRVHLAGREIASLRDRLRGHKEGAEARVAAEAELRAELDEVSGAVADNEQRLARHGVDDHSERLARLEGLRARAGGLAAVVGERLRSIERERTVLVDRDLAAGLGAEIDRCRRELEAVAAAEAEAAPARSELARLQARLEADRAGFRAEWGDGATAPSGEAAETRGELTALRSTIAGDDSESQQLAGRLEALEARSRALKQDADRHSRELGRCRGDAAPLRESSAAADEACAAAAQAREAVAAARAAAEAELRHWTARREALAMALDEAAGPVPLGELAAADGVLGALADLVEVDSGAEAAFAAAVGEAMGAVVVRHAAAARRVLDGLEARDVGAAVIALDGVAPAGVGPVPAGAVGGDRSGAARLRDRVRAVDPGVETLLDVLLASVVMVDGGWRAAADVAASHSSLVVVTAAGDRFSRRGWRLGVHAAAGVRAALVEAVDRVDTASEAHDRAGVELDRARSALDEQQARATDLGRRLAGAERGAETAAEALGRTDSDRRDLDTAAGAWRDHLVEIIRRIERSRARCLEIEARLPELEAAEAQVQQRNRRAARARADLDSRASDVSARIAGARARDAGLEQRRRMLDDRLSELTERRARYDATRAATSDRLAALERQGAVLEALQREIADRSVAVNAGLAEIRELRRRHSEQARTLAVSLDGLRRRSADVEGRLEELRRAAAARNIEEAELRTQLQGAVERLRDDYGLSPSEAVAAPAPALPDGLGAAQRVEQLCAELEIMGPVNPLALVEYDELNERYELLRGQLDDIRAARRDLNRVIRSIDAEIKTVFESAFLDVAANFEVLFEALFPGGEGRLTLSDPDDLLNTGIEISAKPSGKNVKRLSLLSGGERTLAALAFLFAVFRSRPSPFYVMDEVEAALDDVNLHRFLTLIDEFRADAQLVIVTHQKRTMEAADCLHGVSMKPGGSSVVVSERVSAAA